MIDPYDENLTLVHFIVPLHAVAASTLWRLAYLKNKSN